jgi:hypothetical protein
MKADNKKILDENYHHWQTLRDAGYLKGLNVHEKNNLLKVMHEEFAPKYILDMWCGNCVANFVRDLFQRYDRIKESEQIQDQVKQNKEYIAVLNPEGLIGDFLGTIPVMQKFKKDNPDCYFVFHDEIRDLAKLTKLNFLVQSEYEALENDIASEYKFNISRAFELSCRQNLHMIQANYPELCYDVPADIPKPKLYIKPEPVEYVDFLISPFSRSLPEEQKWQKEKWQQLVVAFKKYKFGLLGSFRDDPEFIKADNCINIFDKSFNYVSNTMMKARYGLISVVTGTSHLAYALSVKNFLFINQGAWGKNPEALYITDPINSITVDQVKKFINENIK